YTHTHTHTHTKHSTQSKYQVYPHCRHTCTHIDLLHTQRPFLLCTECIYTHTHTHTHTPHTVQNGDIQTLFHASSSSYATLSAQIPHPCWHDYSSWNSQQLCGRNILSSLSHTHTHTHMVTHTHASTLLFVSLSLTHTRAPLLQQ